MERLCNSLWILLFCWTISLASTTIFSTAELHGTISYGQLTGSGGIESVRGEVEKKRLPKDLLLDVGGFSAGGIYDLAIAGKNADRYRTGQMINEICSLNYTAVNLGDEDLAYGDSAISSWGRMGVPLVSANVVVEGASLIKPYLVVKSDSQLFITGVTTNQPLSVPGAGVTTLPVLESLEKVLNFVPENARIILLAHLTPEEISLVSNTFPQIDVIIRGHRTGTGRAVDTIAGKPVIGFGVEGSSISKTEIEMSWKVVSDLITLKSVKKTNDEKRTVELVDCYVMSGCPYGTEAIRELLKISEEVGSNVEWNLWFTGDIRGDSLVPGLRSGSAQIEMNCIAIGSLYPQLFHDFLWLMTQENGTVESAITEMRLDRLAIKNWVESKGKEILKIHYQRAKRLNVTGSPTIFIRNKEYETELKSNRFQFDLCKSDRKLALFCGKFGECLSNEDCSADSGQVGRCENGESGKNVCHQYEDPVMTVFQLLPDDSSYLDQNNMTETTLGLFPSAKIRTARFGSAKSDSLVHLYQPRKLPFYIFDSSLVQMTNYDQVKQGVVSMWNGFVFTEDLPSSNFYYKRKKHTGEKLYFVKFNSPMYNTLKINFPDLRIVPQYDFELLGQEELRDKIAHDLKELKIALSPQEFYEMYLRDITVESPVWLLEDNQKIEQFRTPESFEHSLRVR